MEINATEVRLGGVLWWCSFLSEPKKRKREREIDHEKKVNGSENTHEMELYLSIFNSNRQKWKWKENEIGIRMKWNAMKYAHIKQESYAYTCTHLYLRAHKWINNNDYCNRDSWETFSHGTKIFNEIGQDRIICIHLYSLFAASISYFASFCFLLSFCFRFFLLGVFFSFLCCECVFTVQLFIYIYIIPLWSC